MPIGSIHKLRCSVVISRMDHLVHYDIILFAFEYSIRGDVFVPQLFAKSVHDIGLFPRVLFPAPYSHLVPTTALPFGDF